MVKQAKKASWLLAIRWQVSAKACGDDSKRFSIPDRSSPASWSS